MSCTFPDISVVILTFNEEMNVRRALESLTWCDDILVIDSYSTDKTESICRSFPNVTFIQRAFVSLADQRQYGLDCGLLKHSWVLALDADEIVPPTLRDELIDIASSWHEGKPIAYDIAMRLIMWGRWLRYSSEYPVYWRRFFRRDCVRYVQRGHADTVDVDGPVGRTNNDLIHDDRKGLSDWLAKHNRYSSQEAEYAIAELGRVPYRYLIASDRALRRRALKRLFRSMPLSDVARFFYLYIIRLGFLDGAAGWRYSRLKAHQAYYVALKIQELRGRHARPVDMALTRSSCSVERVSGCRA
jgi:glycosyltransferase involved in cell wall biosynthesis